MHRLAFLSLLALPALAQPSVDPTSITNAASYITPGQVNSGIAQGSMFIVKGQNLGTCGTVVANTFPLPTTMGTTSIKITVGSTSVNAVMVYVVACRQGPPDQLAAIVPSNTPVGTGTVTVTVSSSGKSASAPITIVPSQFGIFSINQQGLGPGVFTDPNYAVNTLVNSAKPGDLEFTWGTGLGAISSSDAAAPPVGNLNVPVEVWVGGVKASVGYQGRSGCCSGIDQVLFTVPAGVQGCYVPVYVKAGGTLSNFVTMSIAPTGGACSDPTGFKASELSTALTGANIADIVLTQLYANFTFGSTTMKGRSTWARPTSAITPVTT